MGEGVRATPGATHVCYLHTVSRFVFAYERYLGGFGLARAAKPIVAPLVAWGSLSRGGKTSDRVRREFAQRRWRAP